MGDVHTGACPHLTVLWWPRQQGDEWVMDMKCGDCETTTATLSLDEYRWTVE